MKRWTENSGINEYLAEHFVYWVRYIHPGQYWFTCISIGQRLSEQHTKLVISISLNVITSHFRLHKLLRWIWWHFKSTFNDWYAPKDFVQPNRMSYFEFFFVFRTIQYRYCYREMVNFHTHRQIIKSINELFLRLQLQIVV